MPIGKTKRARHTYDTTQARSVTAGAVLPRRAPVGPQRKTAPTLKRDAFKSRTKAKPTTQEKPER